MKKLGVVFAYEFRCTLRSKPYKTISVFLAVVLAALMCFAAYMVFGTPQTDSLQEVQSSEFRVGLVDNAGVGDALREDLPYINFVDAAPTDDFELMLDSGAYDAIIVLTGELSFECYEKMSMYQSSVISDTVALSMGETARANRLAALGVDEQQAREILNLQVSVSNISLGGFDIGKYVYNFLMIILMFLGLGLYGQLVASRVATEKTGRTMELLVTSAPADALLSGKVLGVGAASLLQLSVFLVLCMGGIGVMSFAVPSVAAVLETIKPSGADIVWLLCYFVLGFTLMAYIYGALGSLVSQTEDLSGISSLPQYVFMIGYFISVFSMSSGTCGPLLRVCSYIPVWSPVTMFSRMAAEEVPVWEIVLSLAILAATAAAAAYLSARIYRMGTLMYGKPPKMRELAAMLANERKRKK